MNVYCSCICLFLILGNLIYSPRKMIKERYHTDTNDQFCERMSQVASTAVTPYLPQLGKHFYHQYLLRKNGRFLYQILSCLLRSSVQKSEVFEKNRRCR